MSKRRYAWRALAAGLAAAALFAWVLHVADLSRALLLLRQLGFLLPLALVPNLILSLMETGGWLFAIHGVGARARFRGVLAVRLSADAVALTVPSGSIVAEALTPYLLHRRCGLSYGEGIAATVARKVYVVASHGLWLALAVAVAYPALSRASRRLLHGPLLPGVLLLAAAGLVVASLSLAAASFGGKLGGRIWRGLRRVPLSALRGWIERGGSGFAEIDERLAHFFARGPRALLEPLPLFLLMWVVRSAENLLLLRMVGVEVGFREVMALEPSLVIVRAAFSIFPAGLGVQDLGCLLFLEAMGVRDAPVVGAAYVLLRRGKELAWIGVGYLCLALRRHSGTPQLNGPKLP